MAVNLCATVVGFLTVFKLALLSIHYLIQHKFNEWGGFIIVIIIWDCYSIFFLSCIFGFDFVVVVVVVVVVNVLLVDRLQFLGCRVLCIDICLGLMFSFLFSFSFGVD